MEKVSVIIPARNEEFLQQTIDSVLSAAVEDVEIIAICDGYWPDPPIRDDKRVTLAHHTSPIGQRAAVNEGARIASGKYIMKLDAHCAVGNGFDKVLKKSCKYEWTMVPRMYNLDITTFKPKKHKRTDYMYISSPEHTKPFRAMYYGKYGGIKTKKPPDNGKIDETMCIMGPCFFMHRDRFLEYGGCDEGHGGWGQFGVEMACKAWLSGGALMVNKVTWFAHYFRGGGVPEGFKSGFPYSLTNADIKKAREYSQDLWLNGKWDKQVRSIEWLVDKFEPPTWGVDLTVLYYTANRIPEDMANAVRRNILDAAVGYPIVSVSKKPIKFGENHVVDLPYEPWSIYKQILLGAEKANTKYVALTEDDCLYTAEHFKYRPPAGVFAYNHNRYNLHSEREVQFSFRDRHVLSQCICERDLLIEAMQDRIKVQPPPELCGEFGAGDYEKRMGAKVQKSVEFRTDGKPNIVLCHKKNIGGRKLPTDEVCASVEGWGTAEQVIAKYMPRTGSSGIEFRNQPSRIAGKSGYSVAALYNARYELSEQHKKKSMDVFWGVFENYVEAVLSGIEHDNTSDPAVKGYYEYLTTRLHPADRDGKSPTAKGHRHLLGKLADAKRLIEDIVKSGLRSPLVFYKHTGNWLSIIRGTRRLVILHKLGVKEVPIRVFKTIDDVRLYDPSPDQWQNPSKLKSLPTIHELAMQQFAEYGKLTTDKYWVHGYTSIYDKLWDYKYRQRKLKILELGLLDGYSLRLLHSAFPRAVIHGADKNCSIWKKGIEGLDRIQVHVGNQTNNDFMASLASNGPYDIIIDDCSHDPDMQGKTFNHLWGSVASHGYYIVEDCYWSYTDSNTGVKIPSAFADMVPSLYSTHDIESLQFFYNLCVVQKGLRK